MEERRLTETEREAAIQALEKLPETLREDFGPIEDAGYSAVNPRGDDPKEPSLEEIESGEVARPDITVMSDREMLREMLTIMRGIGDMANDVAPQVLPIMDGIMKNPMFKALGRLG